MDKYRRSQVINLIVAAALTMGLVTLLAIKYSDGWSWEKVKEYGYEDY